MIISFAFIFLLSVSFVSAEEGEPDCVSECESSEDCPDGYYCYAQSEPCDDANYCSTWSISKPVIGERTPADSRKSLSRFSQGSSLIAGWTRVAAANGGDCYIKNARTGFLGRFRSR